VLEEVALRQESFARGLQSTPKGDDLGRKIRIHGDLHLGQGLRSDGRWYIVDLEGEPLRRSANGGSSRRRSETCGHAALGSTTPSGRPHPARRRCAARLGGAGARGLPSGYFPEVERTGILPAAWAVTEELLRLFELEKAVYELAYEVAHRPEWAAIPAECIVALLDREAEA